MIEKQTAIEALEAYQGQYKGLPASVVAGCIQVIQDLPEEDVLSGEELAKVACTLNLLKDYQNIGAIDHLRELVQAEKDGRLVQYVPGDTVYDRFGMEWMVRTAEIHRFDGPLRYIYRCGHPGTDDYCALYADEILTQEEAEKNEPLTLEELRQMDGDPVWVSVFKNWRKSGVYEGWCLVRLHTDDNKIRVYLYDTRFGASYFAQQDYGISWLAYRYKKKEW